MPTFTSRIRTAAVVALAAMAVAVGSAAPAGAKRAAPHRANIVNTAVKAGQFKTLVSLLKRAGLASALAGRGPYTVFAPTDAAFRKVPRRTLNALLADRSKLRAVLLHHVAKGRLTAKKVVELTSVKTLNGDSLTIRTRRSGVFVGGAKVTKPDVLASNGVIHVINRVLVPKS